ncbi:PAP2-domain-containing protein [Saitoella complicata NRRL Y-17804]|uniref:PAP2-domain-containing protein n=1 Tax=Saitoella complicata (strain BCRC 22490 / CBS 7301 / JCM 7358 / NBRC 10748 / NRRL Y-17804) TaxID=698492 RepID=UPI00086704A3|nr:PAP2-domain-containing protein [Saitoella complicata NRRL Y-17804]ODQ55927.1 PAP2-domain-containing protein [Saitoella complicata NRRL Y-17804]
MLTVDRSTTSSPALSSTSASTLSPLHAHQTRRRDSSSVRWYTYLARFARHILHTLLNEKSPTQLAILIFINLIPVIIWMTTFKQARLIPSDIRPFINVDLLPRWEHVLYETPLGLLSQSALLTLLASAALRTRYALLASLIPLILDILHHLAQSLTEWKDVLAWISYGVIHFVSPFLTAFWLWLFAPPGVTGTYGWSFGMQNICGVATHLLFPNAAPWYQTDEYGYGTPPIPANYSMPGSAAGLKRVDAVLGTHIYTHAFKASPLVFGAFPSLHSGFAVINFFFIARYSPRRGRYALGAFVLWQWWATMYLRHHWRLDLIGGALYSTASFLLFLPTLRKYELRARERLRKNGWYRLWRLDWIEGEYYRSEVVYEPVSEEEIARDGERWVGIKAGVEAMDAEGERERVGGKEVVVSGCGIVGS